MKLDCDSKKFYESIANGEDRQKFKDWFNTSNKTFDNMPMLRIDLTESKTLTQLGTIFRDFGIIAKMLYTDKDTIYAESMRHKELREFFIKKSELGLIGKKKKSVQLHTLSQFSKQECIEFIPIYREIWHGVINEQYGEYMIINWSKLENINKPDYEFVRKQNVKT